MVLLAELKSREWENKLRVMFGDFSEDLYTMSALRRKLTQ
jgi:hypothetical protein